MWVCSPRDRLLCWMDLCFDSLRPLTTFMSEGSIFLNKMTAGQWLVFHFSSWSKVENHIWAPSLWTWQLNQVLPFMPGVMGSKTNLEHRLCSKRFGFVPTRSKTTSWNFSCCCKEYSGAQCMLLPDDFSNNLTCKCVFPKIRWRKDPKPSFLHCPLCLDTAFEGVGVCFDQPFWRNWDGLWDPD